MNFAPFLLPAWLAAYADQNAFGHSNNTVIEMEVHLEQGCRRAVSAHDVFM
jgi:hypothetical protein